jgi:hypothetical protein
MICNLFLLILLIPEIFIIYLFKFLFYSLLIIHIYIFIYLFYLFSLSSFIKSHINLKVFYRNMESRLIVIVGPLLYNVVKQKEHNILILSLIERVFSYEHIVLITQW